MDIAIVTGANTRIGLAVSRKLIETGCRVFGLGNNFDDFPLEHTDFVPVTCDLTNTEHLCQVVQEIIDKEKNIYVLVNHARYLKPGPHEKLGLNDLESLVHTNLLAPLILSRLALPSLIRLRGYILNIGFPDLPGSQRLGSAFLATEVALQQFSDRLYEEVRQDKVKVCSLILDTANAETLLKEGYTERDHGDLILCAEAVAQAIEYVISQKRESVVSSLVIRPQKREPDKKDRARVGELLAPAPYQQKGSAKNVVMGRLQKEKVPEDEKSPTTYMDMAREVTLEESSELTTRKEKPQDNERDQAETSSRPNRRRRRRGRSKGPRESQANVPETKNQSKDGKQAKAHDSKRPVNQQIDRNQKSESPPSQDRVAKKRPARKLVSRKLPTRKVATEIVVPDKKVPVSSTEKVVPKKSAAKKPGAKKAIKKTAKKRSTTKNRSA